ncbi:MAG TPA: hypothetical protein VM553_20365 [Dongiaceae bacterium]|nr:hypothetical protein [Dongiaceae bacterium]
MLIDKYDIQPFTPEQQARIEEIIEAITLMAQDPTLSRAERQAMAAALRPIMQKIEDTRLVLEHRLFKHSLAFMYHTKKLGEEGDVTAQAVYEELAALAPNAEIVPFPSKPA